MKRAMLAAVAAVALAVGVPATARADPDTDFANALHIYGIYGQKDYNAWIGKIACKRLWNNLDHDANASATFVKRQLSRDTTTEQTYQFLGAAYRTYCPEKLSILTQMAQPAPGPDTPPPAPAGPALAAEQ
jgi:Protein of unknown function (DUF732)